VGPTPVEKGSHTQAYVHKVSPVEEKKTRVRRTFLWLVVVILTLSIIAPEIPEMSLASGGSNTRTRLPPLT